MTAAVRRRGATVAKGPGWPPPAPAPTSGRSRPRAASVLAQVQPPRRGPLPLMGRQTADTARDGGPAATGRAAPRARRLSSDSSEPEPLLARSPARTSATSKACPVWLCGQRRCDRSPEDGREGCDADPGRWGPPAFGVLRAHGALSATGTPGLQAAGNATGMSVPS